MGRHPSLSSLKSVLHHFTALRKPGEEQVGTCQGLFPNMPLSQSLEGKEISLALSWLLWPQFSEEEYRRQREVGNGETEGGGLACSSGREEGIKESGLNRASTMNKLVLERKLVSRHALVLFPSLM